MDIMKNGTASFEFPYDISDDLGTITETEYQCPGVWYVANEGNGVIAGEYYIVERDAPCISKAAKAYGMFLPNHPELLVYRADDPEHGRNALLYEVAMYRQKNGLPPRDGVPVLDTAVFGMENDIIPLYLYTEKENLCGCTGRAATRNIPLCSTTTSRTARLRTRRNFSEISAVICMRTAIRATTSCRSA